MPFSETTGVVQAPTCALARSLTGLGRDRFVARVAGCSSAHAPQPHACRVTNAALRSDERGRARHRLELCFGEPASGSGLLPRLADARAVTATSFRPWARAGPVHPDRGGHGSASRSNRRAGRGHGSANRRNRCTDERVDVRRHRRGGLGRPDQGRLDPGNHRPRRLQLVRPRRQGLLRPRPGSLRTGR